MVEFDYSGKSPDSSDHSSWPHVINELLRRFLIDDLLREAHDAVTLATQSHREDEAKLAERYSRAARLCEHAFTKDELVNFYVKRLRNAVHEIFYQKVCKLPRQDRGDFSDVRQIGMEIVISQREQWQERAPKGKSPRDAKENGYSPRTVMMIPPTPIINGEL